VAACVARLLLRPDEAIVGRHGGSRAKFIGDALLLSVRIRVAFQVRGAADQIVEAANVRVARVLKC
jgi:class 3 adenylate cyclase